MTTVPTTIVTAEPAGRGPNAGAKDPANTPKANAETPKDSKDAKAKAAKAAKVKGKGKGKGTGEGEEKKSKKKLIIVIALVAVLGYGGLQAKSMFFPPHYTAQHPAPKTTIYPLPLTNPFTVSTSDGHLVETSVSLWLTAAANSAAITSDEGAIENIVITVLGQSTQPILESAAGREAAKTQILTQINQLLGAVHGGQQVAEVLFTGSFVLQ